MRCGFICAGWCWWRGLYICRAERQLATDGEGASDGVDGGSGQCVVGQRVAGKVLEGVAPPYFTNVASRGEERQQAWIFGEKQAYTYKALSLSLGLCERHGGVPGNPEGTMVHGMCGGAAASRQIQSDAGRDVIIPCGFERRYRAAIEMERWQICAPCFDYRG